MLYRIVYFSRNRINGSPEKILSEVHQILAAAQRSNATKCVTGALIFNSGGFAQVLEGEREQVSAIFEKIQRDPRHSDVLVLDYSRVEKRGFPNWSMAFVGQSRGDERLFGAISDASGFDAKALSALEIFSAMKRLVLEEEVAA